MILHIFCCFMCFEFATLHFFWHFAFSIFLRTSYASNIRGAFFYVANLHVWFFSIFVRLMGVLNLVGNAHPSAERRPPPGLPWPAWACLGLPWLGLSFTFPRFVQKLQTGRFGIRHASQSLGFGTKNFNKIRAPARRHKMRNEKSTIFKNNPINLHQNSCAKRFRISGKSETFI